MSSHYILPLHHTAISSPELHPSCTHPTGHCLPPPRKLSHPTQQWIPTENTSHCSTQHCISPLQAVTPPPNGYHLKQMNYQTFPVDRLLSWNLGSSKVRLGPVSYNGVRAGRGRVCSCLSETCWLAGCLSTLGCFGGLRLMMVLVVREEPRVGG